MRVAHSVTPLDIFNTEVQLGWTCFGSVDCWRLGNYRLWWALFFSTSSVGEGKMTQAHARRGSPATEIASLAGELGVGLLVMGSRGLGGIKRALMGSVSESVVNHAHCPVMVVRHGGRPLEPYLSMLAGSTHTNGTSDVATGRKIGRGKCLPGMTPKAPPPT
jgi:hypothetical protein